MKKGLFLSLFYSLTIGAGLAKAVDIETVPIEQNNLSSHAGEKQSATIGRRDPEKEKPHGVGVNVFLSKNVAVSSSVSVAAPEPNMQTVNSGGLGFNVCQVGGGCGAQDVFQLATNGY